MKAEGLQPLGIVAAAFRDVQLPGIFDGRDDGGADSGRLTDPWPVRLTARGCTKLRQAADGAILFWTIVAIVGTIGGVIIMTVL